MKPEKTPIIADDLISATVPLAALRMAVAGAAGAPECRERSTIPILSYLMIGADAVEYRGIDMSSRFPVEGGTGSGRVMVPARSIVAALEAMDGETVEIRKAKGDRAVSLTCGDVKASFVTLPVKDALAFLHVDETRTIPATPATKNTPASPERVETLNVREFALGEGVIASLLALTTPFISTEGTRYYLQGVALLSEDGERLRAVATDGHRLGSRDTGLSAPIKPFTARIIPRAFVGYLEKVAGGAEVGVVISTNRVVFTIRGAVISGVLIDGTFPDFRRVVPNAGSNAITFDVAAAARIAAAARKFSRMRGRAVLLEAMPDAVRFTTKDPDSGEISGKVAARIEGEPHPRVGCNATYLADILRAFRSKRLRFQIDTEANGGHGAPCLITDPDSPDSGYAVLMPMRV